jgi:hypothetical protein
MYTTSIKMYDLAIWQFIIWGYLWRPKTALYKRGQWFAPGCQWLF